MGIASSEIQGGRLVCIKIGPKVKQFVIKESKMQSERQLLRKSKKSHKTVKHLLRCRIL